MPAARGTRWRSVCGWAPTRTATSAASTSIRFQTPGPTASTGRRRSGFRGINRSRSTPAGSKPTASPTMSSIRTTRPPGPTAATGPPRVSLQSNPPSTSWPNGSASTRPCCATATWCAKGCRCRPTTTRLRTPARLTAAWNTAAGSSTGTKSTRCGLCQTAKSGPPASRWRCRARRFRASMSARPRSSSARTAPTT